MKVVIAGATGFIGRPLAAALRRAGHEVVALTRDPSRAGARLPEGVTAVAWSGDGDLDRTSAALSGAQVVVNLAGASIGEGRWTEARKHVLLQSRVRSTAALVSAAGALHGADRPQALINASGIDYYGDDSSDRVYTERNAAGDSFLARVCVEWEAAARQADALGLRVVLMRTSLVIGRGAKALQMMALPFRLFAGGPLGSGRQWFDWIHLDDMVGLYLLAVERTDVGGPLNAVAPDVRRQREVAQEMGRALGRPSLMPAPAFALRAVLGDQADLLLHGRHAVPASAEAAGYPFRYPRLDTALAEALGA